MAVNFMRKLRNKQILFVLSLLSFYFGTVACQNNKSRSNRNTTQYPIPGGYYGGNYGGALCPTCNMNVAWTVFAGTDSQSGLGSVSLSLDFYGDPTTGYNFYDPKIPVTYSGPVVVRGQLTVNMQDSLICNVPVGQYQIISLSPGQWQSGVVSSSYSGYGPTSLYMDAVSNYGTIRLKLAKGVIYNPSGTSSWYPNNLGGTLVFESFNGYPCYSMSGMPAYAEMF